MNLLLNLTLSLVLIPYTMWNFRLALSGITQIEHTKDLHRFNDRICCVRNVFKARQEDDDVVIVRDNTHNLSRRRLNESKDSDDEIEPDEQCQLTSANSVEEIVRN